MAVSYLLKFFPKRSFTFLRIYLLISLMAIRRAIIYIIGYPMRTKFACFTFETSLVYTNPHFAFHSSAAKAVYAPLFQIKCCSTKGIGRSRSRTVSHRISLLPTAARASSPASAAAIPARAKSFSRALSRRYASTACQQRTTSPRQRYAPPFWRRCSPQLSRARASSFRFPS